MYFYMNLFVILIFFREESAILKLSSKFPKPIIKIGTSFLGIPNTVNVFNFEHLKPHESGIVPNPKECNAFIRFIA